MVCLSDLYGKQSCLQQVKSKWVRRDRLWRGHFVLSARGRDKNANWQLEPDIFKMAVPFQNGRAIDG